MDDADASPDRLRVLVVDDEPLARLRLRGLVESLETPAAQVVGEAGDAAEALRRAREGGCDVALLDIRMPGGGLELAEALRRLPAPPAVVFVTAHAGHALAAFDLDAVDYLTKPVRRERLQRAMQRVAARRGTVPAPPAAGTPAVAPALPAGPADPPAVLVVGERGRLLRLPLAEVLYLRAGGKQVTVRTVQAAYVVDDALAELEQRLGPGFVRIHRNAIVARHAVRALKHLDLGGAGDDGESAGWAVQLAVTGEWLAVSRRQIAAVREALAAP